MKNLLKLCWLAYFLTTLANSTPSVKLTDDNKSSEPNLCKSIESARAEIKDELFEIRKEISKITGTGM